MYCIKCKEKTKTDDITEAVSKNNRKMLKGTCAICGIKKSTFVKGSSSGKGIVSNVVGKIPVIGDFLGNVLEKIGLGIKDPNKFRKSCHCKGINLDEFQKHYRGGFLPLIPLIGAILGGLGGIGGLAGGITAAVNSSKSVSEQERHNREIEKQIKGAGLFLTPQGSGLFLGPWRE
jgi:hypothetical protein